LNILAGSMERSNNLIGANGMAVAMACDVIKN
jgi:hypothetical protein